MNKSGSCYQIKFVPQESYVEEISEFLEDFFEVVVCNYTDDNMEEYVAYENTKFDEKKFIKEAKKRKINLPEYEVSLLTSENWLKDNVIEFAPVEIGDFLIYGIHEKEVPKTDKTPIKIYAATAFGSEHQTTKACLEAIAKLRLDDVKKDKILDMGCGSGILAIACAKIWQNSKIFAVDIDEEAVWVTRQNATDNFVDDIVSAEVSDGYRAKFVKENGKYDIIIANILARPLIEMSADLYENLADDGYAILSGFVDNQVDWVLESHIDKGLKHIKTYEIDNWRASLLKKG